VEQIVEIWRLQVQRTVGLKRAEQLMEVAQQSIGLKIGLDMARMEIQFLLQQVEMIQQQLNELDAQIKALLDQIPGAQEMQSIPGVGFLTVAGFLAEVGDLRRFAHPRQIQKLAGLNLTVQGNIREKPPLRNEEERDYALFCIAAFCRWSPKTLSSRRSMNTMFCGERIRCDGSNP
jgi:transposase